MPLSYKKRLSIRDVSNNNMWIIEKKVGIFVHYLTLSGRFQPGIEKARQFPSLEMAKVME
ncbi:MAG: hypothetical protein AB4372_25800 [Xenococcus sp. (in: cyanobacteria)]